MTAISFFYTCYSKFGFCANLTLYRSKIFLPTLRHTLLPLRPPMPHLLLLLHPPQRRRKRRKKSPTMIWALACSIKCNVLQTLYPFACVVYCLRYDIAYFLLSLCQSEACRQHKCKTISKAHRKITSLLWYIITGHNSHIALSSRLKTMLVKEGSIANPLRTCGCGHVLATTTGLITPGFIFAVRKMSSSDEKCPNAKR